MKKFKLFLDIIKEEKWLNEELQKGCVCTNVNSFGVYTFKKTNKPFVMRLDYRGYLSKEKFEEYQNIYRDFDWLSIKSSRLGGIQYWQKENDDQSEIFSDSQSKRSYYKRLMGYSVMWGLVFVFIHYVNFGDSFFSGLYHEALWDMKGSLFWKAFLFETPFVLFKSVALIMAIVLFYNAYRQYSILKEN